IAITKRTNRWNRLLQRWRFTKACAASRMGKMRASALLLMALSVACNRSGTTDSSSSGSSDDGGVEDDDGAAQGSSEGSDGAAETTGRDDSDTSSSAGVTDDGSTTTGTSSSTTEGSTSTSTTDASESATSEDTGAEATPVIPTDNRAGVMFSGPTHRLMIDAVGARVMEYSLDGQNVLYTDGTRLQQGSTFWVAPQSSWTDTDDDWPPPTAIDDARYEYVIDGATATFTSQEDASLGLSVTKTFAMTSTGEVTITYTMIASRDLTTPWAPWEVSRHPPGLCFFARGGETPQFSYNLDIADMISVVEDSGVAWVPYSGPLAKHGELLADAAGWAGCAFESTRHLLLKQFADVSGGSFSAGNGDLKI